MAESYEPEITINGITLTTNQAMTVRVAVSQFDPDCGDDEHGKHMTAAYKAALHGIFKAMFL